MSRRLQIIPTGYVDYGAVGEKFLAGVQQGVNIMEREKERQRRLLEIEQRREAAADAIYRQNQADVERFGNDLSTSEKEAFVSQYDALKEMNRSIQEYVRTGGNVGSKEYSILQDNFEKQKKDLLMKIGALKEVKGVISNAVKLRKDGLIGWENEFNTAQNVYNSLLSGKYVPSVDIPTVENMTMSAYKSPVKVFSSSFVNFDNTKTSHVVRDAKNKIIRTERKEVPEFNSLASVANGILNSPPAESTGVIKEYEQFKIQNKDGIAEDYKGRYDKYLMYMKDINQQPKDIKDFTPLDYTMMEILARKYNPAPDFSERFYTERRSSGGGGGGSQSDKDAANMSAMLNDLFSGDSSKANSVLSKIKGGLKTRGWSINQSGLKITASKSADEYDSGASYDFNLSDTPENRAAAMGMINSYYTAIGSGKKLK
jgi:hypothetical protein